MLPSLFRTSYRILEFSPRHRCDPPTSERFLIADSNGRNRREVSIETLEHLTRSEGDGVLCRVADGVMAPVTVLPCPRFGRLRPQVASERTLDNC